MGVGLPTAQSLIFRKKKLRGRHRWRCGETDGVPEVDNPPAKHHQSYQKSSFGFHFVQISETRLRKIMKKKPKNKNKYWLDTKSHRNLEVMRPDNEFKERTSLDMTQVCYPSGLFFNSDHYVCSHLISSHQHWGRSSPASGRRQTGTNWQRLGLSPGEEPPTVGDHICPESPIHGASAPPAEFKRRRKPKAGPATAATPRCHLAADTDVAHLTFRL